jgi:hypothetical protein
MYEWNGTEWKRQIIDQGRVSAAGCAVADLGQEGHGTIACIGSATHNLALYRLPAK